LISVDLKPQNSYELSRYIGFWICFTSSYKFTFHINSSKVKVVTVDMLVTSSCTVNGGLYSHNAEYPNIYPLPKWSIVPHRIVLDNIYFSFSFYDFAFLDFSNCSDIRVFLCFSFHFYDLSVECWTS
jgi:hypothetical protein